LGADAWVTASQLRQDSFGRTWRTTRNESGTYSRISVTSSPRGAQHAAAGETRTGLVATRCRMLDDVARQRLRRGTLGGLGGLVFIGICGRIVAERMR